MYIYLKKIVFVKTKKLFNVNSNPRSTNCGSNRVLIYIHYITYTIYLKFFNIGFNIKFFSPCLQEPIASILAQKQHQDCTKKRRRATGYLR